MTPEQIITRADELMSLLAVRTGTAVETGHGEDLAQLSRTVGRVRCIDRRLSTVVLDASERRYRVYRLMDELYGGTRVARRVVRALALREARHRADVEQALATRAA